jgi:hypothetical protein
MDAFLDRAAWILAHGYVVYVALLAVTGLFGLHLLIFGMLLVRGWRRALTLQIVYGFLNPLVYLLVLNRDGALLRWNALDPWMAAIAWALFLGFWGARLFLARDVEVSATVTARLHRLCLLGLVCLAAFTLRDFVRLWLLFPVNEFRLGDLNHLWMLIAFAPLYLIPAFLLNGYRVRLAQDTTGIRFLLLSRPAARRLALTLATIVVFFLSASIFRGSDARARRRVEQLTPAIELAAARYSVDPKLLAAIVYVSEREVGPFRDELERFASSAFTLDEGGEFLLPRRFDLSIGAAQIKPLTALTALKLCQASGQPWDLQRRHVRDVPTLDSEWTTRPSLLTVCQPPTMPVPISKADVVEALRRDESNVAFAALILALYQWQWREANAAWDISARPEILATLYQIGFVKSRPHDAPRSSGFGQRVAEVTHQAWLSERFDGPRVAMRDSGDR